MKKILTSAAIALLMLISLSSFAINKMNPLKNQSAFNIVTHYLEAISLGNIEHNTFLFSADFEYQNGHNMEKYSREQYCKYLKETKGYQYDCQTSCTILDECNNTCVAKTSMRFKNFTRIDYITLQKTEGTWKVSKVFSSYI